MMNDGQLKKYATLKNLQHTKQDSTHIKEKVHRLSEQWESFKKRTQKPRKRLPHILENVIRHSKDHPQQKHQHSNSKLLFYKSLSPLNFKEISNFDDLIHKCEKFHKGLEKAINNKGKTRTLKRRKP